jgi:hypothetical protein
MAQRKRNAGAIRDLELVANVVDLTGATEDYPLSVNETAKVSITAQSTLLHVAVVSGIYKLWITFDATTFAGTQDIQLLPNNTTFSNEFRIIAHLDEVALGGDEVDVDQDSSTFDNFYLEGFPGSFNMIPWGIDCTIFIGSGTASLISHSHGLATNQRQQTIGMEWRTSVWTSLGTINAGEIATGTAYIKREA